MQQNHLIIARNNSKAQIRYNRKTKIRAFLVSMIQKMKTCNSIYLEKAIEEENQVSINLKINKKMNLIKKTISTNLVITQTQLKRMQSQYTAHSVKIRWSWVDIKLLIDLKKNHPQ